MTISSPTAFVAGATGYTGREVVRILRERGLRTIAHVRSDSPRINEWRERFTAMGAETDTTPWSLPEMTATLARHQPGVIFSLIGTTRARMKALAKTGRDAQAASYAAVDAGLTRLLINAARALETPPLLVYLSAMGAGGPAIGGYLQARREAESALKISGLPYLIARPGIITGPDRDESRTLEEWGGYVSNAASRLLRSIGLRRLSERYRPIAGNALATALVAAALDPAKKNAILESEDLHVLGS